LLVALHNFFERAWAASISSMGTTSLAVLGSLLYPVSNLWNALKKYGWRGLIRDWRERVGYSAIIAVAWWACLFSYHLLWTVPRQVYADADKAAAPFPLPPRAPLGTLVSPTVEPRSKPNPPRRGSLSQ
jgi:hypothetical protein